MPITRDFTEELLSRIDIVELVSGYIPLKKSGSNMMGLCPFHTEKTPSFSVSSDKQIFKCFGCGQGGTAIQFIMQIEHLPFVEAVEVLAKRAGMTIPEQEGREEYTSRRRRILELNKAAAKHFYKMLTTDAGKPAREYLASRGITKETVKKFGLGAAPDDWTLLLDAMKSKGFTQQDMLDAGLARKSEKSNKPYDFFRGRVMFPVIDVRGDVIAFSGRLLSSDAKNYKYLNSPDTIVFNKSSSLFGLNLAKKSTAGRIVLVEGNFDVVTLHQAGIDCAVAQLGSAFTAQHARLLAKYTEEIILAFDGDEAGRKATLKALPLLEATGKNIRVINFGNADPDEFIRKNGVQAFHALIEKSENDIEYKLQTILNKHDIKSDSGRLAYLSDATFFLAELPSQTQREIYSGKVAGNAGVSLEAVNNEVTRILKRKQSKKRFDQKKSLPRPKETVMPSDRAIRYKNAASAVAEEGVVRCLMKDQTFIRVIAEEGLEAEDFTSDFLAKIFMTIKECIESDSIITQTLIMSHLSPEEASHLTTVLDRPETLAAGEKALREYIKKIKTEKYKQSQPTDEMLIELAKLKKGG